MIIHAADGTQAMTYIPGAAATESLNRAPVAPLTGGVLQVRVKVDDGGGEAKPEKTMVALPESRTDGVE